MDDLVVTRLSTTPIKGMRLHHPDHIVLDETGAVGDRDFVLASDDDRLVSITACGELVDMTATWDAGARWLTIASGDGRRARAPVELGESVLSPARAPT